jgi:hypothetical protein
VLHQLRCLHNHLDLDIQQLQLGVGFGCHKELLADSEYPEYGVASRKDGPRGQSGSSYRDSEPALEDSVHGDRRLDGGTQTDENPGEPEYDASLGVEALRVCVHRFPLGGNLVQQDLKRGKRWRVGHEDILARFRGCLVNATPTRSGLLITSPASCALVGNLRLEKVGT